MRGLIRALCCPLLLLPLVSCRARTMSLQEEAALGARSYAQVLSQNEVIAVGPDKEMVERVANRLVEAARVSDPEIVDAFQWEVSLLDDPSTINAFALPGGKMACYSGMIPVAETEAGLATVMGHEIAHVTRRHGTKQMQREMGRKFLTLLAFAKAEDAGKLAVIFVSRLAKLKFSRTDELEADAVGLHYMARAGYDPSAAVDFWTRMEEATGKGPPQFLSTHPSDGTRVRRIEDQLPEALEIYAASGAAELDAPSP